MQRTLHSLSFIVLTLMAGMAIAQDAGTSKALVGAGKGEVTKRTPAALTAEQKKQAMAFAREHHPELAELLTQLQKHSPGGFKRGIREVQRSAQRLNRMKEKQPARYEYELKRWKTDSRIRLMTARWIMSQDPDLEQQILMLLQDRQEARLDRLSKDRDKLAARLKQIEEQLANASDKEAIDNEWKRLKKRATVGARTKRPNRPAKPQTTPENNEK